MSIFIRCQSQPSFSRSPTAVSGCCARCSEGLVMDPSRSSWRAPSRRQNGPNSGPLSSVCGACTRRFWAVGRSRRRLAPVHQFLFLWLDSTLEIFASKRS